MQDIDICLNDKFIRSEAMIDSGAMGMGFIDRIYAGLKGLCTVKLEQVVNVKSVDGTACGNGTITEKVSLKIRFEDFNDFVDLLVIDCPNAPIIFGLDWLKKYNPVIDWKNGKTQNLTNIKINFYKI